MSGDSAMAVVAHGGLVGEADERLNDVCITFAEVFVRMAAAVIAGAKPAAIFSLPMRAYSGGRWRSLVRAALDEALQAYARELPGYGVRLSVLHRTDQRVYLLVWRPEAIAAIFDDKESVAILRDFGYATSTAGEAMCELRRKLVAFYQAKETGEATFPHEIGIFLGYPAEDVRGFMEGRTATCSGPWHAYGDVHAARRRFRALKLAERSCRLRFAAGEPLCSLFAPQACVGA